MQTRGKGLEDSGLGTGNPLATACRKGTRSPRVAADSFSGRGILSGLVSCRAAVTPCLVLGVIFPPCDPQLLDAGFLTWNALLGVASEGRAASWEAAATSSLLFAVCFARGSQEPPQGGAFALMAFFVPASYLSLLGAAGLRFLGGVCLSNVPFRVCFFKAGFGVWGRIATGLSVWRRGMSGSRQVSGQGSLIFVCF